MIYVFILENWFAIEKNLSSFQHRDCLNDVTDGRVYKTEVPLNPDENGTCTLSITWNIDGSTAIKSRDLKIWHIFAMVIELPKKLRYSFRNILFCGLWYGKEKPEFSMFQKHFVTNVKDLMNGFPVQLSDRVLSCKLRIQGQVADLPAKAASLNFKQFNGKFGCSVCLEPGKKDTNNQLVRYYPHKARKPPLQNHIDMLQHAELANNTNAVFGVKGPSPVHEILKIPEKVLLDFMHQVLEGKLQRKLRSFFVSSSDEDPYCLKESLHAVDEMIMSVQLPHDFPKKMRSIAELRKWKAHEKEIFLFHMSLPALRKYLPSDYFFRHSLFVTGMCILTADSVSEEDIQLSEAMLDAYIRLVEPLYGYAECTYNLHSLGHFAEQTRNHGNPILQSAFVFEGMISLLRRKFHGTRGIIPQMLRNVAVAQTTSLKSCNMCTIH